MQMWWFKVSNSTLKYPKGETVYALDSSVSWDGVSWCEINTVIYILLLDIDAHTSIVSVRFDDYSKNVVYAFTHNGLCMKL